MCHFSLQSVHWLQDKSVSQRVLALIYGEAHHLCAMYKHDGVRYKPEIQLQTLYFEKENEKPQNGTLVGWVGQGLYTMGEY